MNGNATRERQTITRRQSAALITSTIIGPGVLTLPRTSTESAMEAGWLSTIIGALLSMIAVMAITQLSRRFPRMTLVQYSAEILGISKSRTVGYVLRLPILLAYAVFWGMGAVLVARVFSEVVITTVLTETPLEIILLTMLVTALVLVMYDVDVLARVNEILVPVILIPVLLIALYSFKSAQLDHLLPIVPQDWMGVLKDALASTYSFLGFEIMTLFLAWSNPDGRLLRSNTLGVAVPGLIYTLIVISGISVFGVDELRLLMWPTLELVKTTEVPGQVLERLESAFLGVWVVAVFTTVGNMYYSTCLLIRESLGLKGHKWLAAVLLPLMYWLALLPPNIHALFDMQSYFGLLGIAVAYVIPVLLLGIAVIRRKGNAGGQTGTDRKKESANGHDPS